MIPQGTAVIAALSGGSDSVCMLDLLNRLRTGHPFRLFAVHVDHQIRGDEALRDRSFSEELCRKMEIPCRVIVRDVPRLAKEMKTGLEEAGSRARKEAFKEAAAYFAGDGTDVRIATAHHQGDLAETVLHHIARGTGLPGLSSLRPVSGSLIRPILCLEEEEILLYLRDRNLPYVTDSTNAQDLYTRNRIRHVCLPVLRENINSQADAHLAALSEEAAETTDYMNGLAEKILEQCTRLPEGLLLNEPFLKAPEAVRTYVLLQALEETGGRRDVTAVHIKAMKETARGGQGRRVSLPGGRTAVRRSDGLLLQSKDSMAGSRGQEPEAVGIIPGQPAFFREFTLYSRLFDYKCEKIVEKKYTKWLDYDKIDGTLKIRTRRTGDRMTVLSEGGSKKLTRLMMEEGIPADQRDLLPVITDDSEVLWIVGERISEKAKITGDTRRVLELVWYPEKTFHT